MNTLKSGFFAIVTIIGIIVSIYLSYIMLFVLALWIVFIVSKTYLDEKKKEHKPKDDRFTFKFL